MVGRLFYVGVRLLALTVLLMARVPAQAAEIGIGQQLPEVQLQGLNGPSRPLSSFRGRPLLINMWASWCEPCRQEMASLERLAWRDDGRTIAIIGVSTDDNAQQALTLLHGTHATISHFIDVRQQLEALLGATRIPLTVLIDSDGRVRARVYGARQWDSAAQLQLLRATLAAHKLRQTPPAVLP